MSAFWSQNPNDPLRRYRWYIQFTGQLQDAKFALKECKKPEYEINVTEHKLLNHVVRLPGILKWKPITIKFASARGQNIRQDIANLLYKATKNGNYTGAVERGSTMTKPCMVSALESNRFNIIQVDADGNDIEIWSLHNTFISNINFGSLSYESDDIVDIECILQYDWAELNASDFATKLNKNNRLEKENAEKLINNPQANQPDSPTINQLNFLVERNTEADASKVLSDGAIGTNVRDKIYKDNLVDKRKDTSDLTAQGLIDIEKTRRILGSLVPDTEYDIIPTDPYKTAVAYLDTRSLAKLIIQSRAANRRNLGNSQGYDEFSSATAGETPIAKDDALNAAKKAADELEKLYAKTEKDLKDDPIARSEQLKPSSTDEKDLKAKLIFLENDIKDSKAIAGDNQSQFLASNQPQYAADFLYEAKGSELTGEISQPSDSFSLLDKGEADSTLGQLDQDLLNFDPNDPKAKAAREAAIEEGAAKSLQEYIEFQEDIKVYAPYQPDSGSGIDDSDSEPPPEFDNFEETFGMQRPEEERKQLEVEDSRLSAEEEIARGQAAKAKGQQTLATMQPIAEAPPVAEAAAPPTPDEQPSPTVSSAAQPEAPPVAEAAAPPKPEEQPKPIVSPTMPPEAPPPAEAAKPVEQAEKAPASPEPVVNEFSAADRSATKEKGRDTYGASLIDSELNRDDSLNAFVETPTGPPTVQQESTPSRNSDDEELTPEQKARREKLKKEFGFGNLDLGDVGGKPISLGLTDEEIAAQRAAAGGASESTGPRGSNAEVAGINVGSTSGVRSVADGDKKEVEVKIRASAESESTATGKTNQTLLQRLNDSEAFYNPYGKTSKEYQAYKSELEDSSYEDLKERQKTLKEFEQQLKKEKDKKFPSSISIRGNEAEYETYNTYRKYIKSDLADIQTVLTTKHPSEN